MVDKELIEIWRNMLKSPISSWLLKTNYEGMGEQDKEEFECDFDEILDLALIGLKHKAQLSQEGTTTDTISRQAAIDALDCISGVEEVLKSLPSAQPEQLESEDVTFWKKRAKEYEEMVGELTAEMARGVKIDSVLLTEEGIVFKKKKPEQWWIPCSKQMPNCEQEVLICTEKKVYISKETGMEWYFEPIVTPAIYEDGSMLEVHSKWSWEDIDYAGWDEEEDCGIIPEGWWENRHFNPDEVYNNVVDRRVVAWMPLPEPYDG